MDGDVRRINEMLAEEPSLAADLLQWAERARRHGPDRPFLAFRQRGGATQRSGALALRRCCGAAPSGNLLYRADNLLVLRDLLERGERPRCVYIDPPYGTSQRFMRKATEHDAYCDAMTGAAYLTMMQPRLVLLRELLADDGSLFVHLDASMVGEMKLLLDELFGPSNFRGWITRRKCSSKNYTRKGFGDITDYILLYTRTGRYVWNRQFETRSEEQEAIDFPKVDEATGRRFALVPLHAPGRRNGSSGGPWKGRLPPAGKHWQWTPERLDRLERDGDIYWTRNGTPRRKIWADESPGSAVSNLWLDFRDPFNQNFAVTGYPTEKNIDMLRRMISAASNPGDLVLDCFAGSGTALVAAAELGRRWIGVDKSQLAAALSQRRLAERSLDGTLPDGHGGFQFWTKAPDARCEASLADAEFAFLEEVEATDDSAIIQDVMGPAQAESAIGGLGPNERLTAFDHGGREFTYARARSIQLAESLPA